MITEISGQSEEKDVVIYFEDSEVGRERRKDGKWLDVGLKQVK